MEWFLEKLGHEIASHVAKHVAKSAYEQAQSENERAADYAEFFTLMDEIAKKRTVECKPGELSQNCPFATVIPQMYNPDAGGTDEYRAYTIVGSDGQIINVQGYLLAGQITFTVRHTNGKIDYEKVDPSEAMKRIGREAGYHLH